MKRVLVACEYSGVVRDAFARRGFVAWSCDFLPTESPGLHYVGDVRNLLAGWVPVQRTGEPGMEYRETRAGLFGRPRARPHWDLLIAHPPCTYLSASGLHWNTRVPGREAKTQEALAFVRTLLNAPVQRIALENPVGRIGTAVRKADQCIQPWQFGHDASKTTCLWLKNLPLLQPTRLVSPRIVDGRKRWGNQTDSGQNRLGPSEDRWKLRSTRWRRSGARCSS